MNNIEELRSSLLSNIKEIKDGSLPVKEAEAITNTAGKVLGTVITQLKYSDLRKEKPEIAFLEGGSKKIDNNNQQIEA